MCNRKLFLSAIALGTVLCSGCSSQPDVGRVPRQIRAAEAELGPIQSISGRTAAGVEVTLAVRPYTGSQVGFWGAETSPPIDLLWSFDFVIGGDHVHIPKEYLQDLANVLLSPNTQAIESLLVVNPNRLTVNRLGDHYEVRLNAGDGANAYEASFEVMTTALGAISVRRTVRYHLDDPNGPWG